MSKTEEIACPFCGEDDFDKEGLKCRLENYCEEYHNITISPCFFSPFKEVE